MFAMRKLAYVVAGDTYRPSGPLLDVLIYEHRKDVITYASIVLTFLVLRRLAAPPTPAGRLNRPEALIEVRDGSQLAWFKPEEIDWIGAAGNYVELHGAFGTKLTRRSLSEMEAELAPHGFVRVHRSRLVRRGSVARIEIRQSGDFVLTLRSGSIVSGSRRYRECLGARAVSHSELAE
jgi:DNA-binding LytR/AlgR family response regulator